MVYFHQYFVMFYNEGINMIPLCKSMRYLITLENKYILNKSPQVFSGFIQYCRMQFHLIIQIRIKLTFIAFEIICFDAACNALHFDHSQIKRIAR